MTRPDSSGFAYAALFTALAIVLSALVVSARVQDQPAETILRGRLATVEPAARRITIIPDGEVNLAELFVAQDGEVRLDDRALTLSELVIQVGQRVSVSYLMDGAHRIARRITVEAA